MQREQKILDRHLRHWRERGLVSDELELRLRSASQELGQSQTSNVVRAALAVLGGGLVLAGLILIIAENWEALHRSVKLGSWAALQCGFLAAAFHLSRRWPERPYLAEAFTLVAGGWVLGGISLVSQIYHLDARPANGIWLWLALVLPLAWAVERRAVSVVVFVASVTALGLEVADSSSWVHADRADGPWLWLGLPALCAVAASALPRPVGWLRDWVGAWIFGAGQVFLLVLGASQDLDRSDLGAAWLVAAAGIAAALAMPHRLLPQAWGSNGARLVVGLTLLPWIVLGEAYSGTVLLDQLAVGLSWVIQLGVAILIIRAGARSSSKSWVNLGYLALLVGVMTRYFDFFGEFLEGGVALVGTGLAMLFVLYALEKARRRTLRREVAA